MIYNILCNAAETCRVLLCWFEDNYSTNLRATIGCTNTWHWRFLEALFSTLTLACFSLCAPVKLAITVFSFFLFSFFFLTSLLSAVYCWSANGTHFDFCQSLFHVSNVADVWMSWYNGLGNVRRDVWKARILWLLQLDLGSETFLSGWNNCSHYAHLYFHLIVERLCFWIISPGRSFLHKSCIYNCINCVSLILIPEGAV